MIQQILPRALRPGSVVAMVCPSASVTDEIISLVQGIIEGMGYKAFIHPQCYRKEGFFAGHDQERADALHETFSDPRIDAIFCVRGGYGAMRLLDKLDYDLIANNPKIFMGMSDITALQWAITSQTGLITFSGPTRKMWLGPASTQCQTWVKEILEGKTRSIPTTGAKVNYPGEAEGELWGGNFALIRSMAGTLFMPQGRDLILFGEDVDEHTLRLDNLFQHLKYTGILQDVQGVALGEFLQCKDYNHGKTITELLHDAMPGFKGPIVEGLPFGHGDHHCVLPIGAKAKLSAHNGQIKLELLQRVVENTAS